MLSRFGGLIRHPVMKNISLVLLLACAAMCCNKGGPDCAQAIDHSMELAKGDLPAGDVHKLRDLAVHHCTEDKWPVEALQCMVDAKSEPDAQACYGKLTPEQQGKMNSAAK